MTPKIARIFILTLIIGWTLCRPTANANSAEKQISFSIRPSILAGSWYPGSATRLRKMVADFLRNASVPPIKGKLRAIIVPHAGYKYSGQVAAYAYKVLQSHTFKRVILIGPSHRIPFHGVSVNLERGYETPLGIVKVDVDTGKRIINSDPSIHCYREVHAVEHSLEIQLPFLQTVLKDFSIIPILMGVQDYSTCQRLARVLTGIMPSLENTLLVASSDLSHYHPYFVAKKLDSRFIKLVKDMDPKGLYEALRAGQCEACGGGPVIATLLTCLALGADHVVILNAANSGDVTGEKDTVVGYMAGAIFTSFGRDQHPE